MSGRRKWFAPMPTWAHYWRLQKLYFVSYGAALPVVMVGAILIVRFGYSHALMAATCIVGLIVMEVAWRWADKRIAK